MVCGLNSENYEERLRELKLETLPKDMQICTWSGTSCDVRLKADSGKTTIKETKGAVLTLGSHRSKIVLQCRKCYNKKINKQLRVTQLHLV